MFAGMRLGLKPCNPDRVRSVRLAPTRDPLMSRVPHDWQLGRPWDADILGNDVRGNCGPVAVLNWVKLMAAVVGMPMSLTTDDANRLYQDCGWDGTEEGDDGVILLNLLELWMRRPVGGIRPRCFFRVAFGDAEHLATALNIAPLIVGASLTVACQSTDTWDARVAQDPAEWGGHAYLYHSDSPGGGSGKSWGAPVFNTPEFRVRKWREAYLPICDEFVPPGVDVSRLVTLAGQL